MTVETLIVAEQELLKVNPEVLEFNQLESEEVEEMYEAYKMEQEKWEHIK